MHQRDIPKLPTKIDRKEFVDIIFDLGLSSMHGYDTIVAAVQLGDKFVSYSGPRISFNDIQSGSSDIDIMNQPVPQEYSTELAHVVTIITCKVNEDNGYMDIKEAIYETCNSYVAKIEWEICILFDFNLKVNNFITLIGALVCHKKDEPITLNSAFYDLSKQICSNLELLNMNPFTVVAGILILAKHGKLRASHDNKERIFSNMMIQLSKEYEVELSDVLREYKSLHTQ